VTVAKTRIICTLGPASSSKEVILALAQNGMGVARFNMAHGTHETHAGTMAIVREVSRELERPIDVMVDVKGPEIRTGDVKEPMEIREGQEVVFSPRPYEVRLQDSKTPKFQGRSIIEVNYDAFAEDVKEAERILLDGGEIEFEVKGIEGLNVIAVAKSSGTISSRRHINLPGAEVDLPAITAKDWSDIQFALRAEAEMIALSFVRSSDNVTSVKRFLEGKGEKGLKGVRGVKRMPKIVAKIETRQALNDLTAIIEAADIVMVARGDLGCEVSLASLPRIQDEIVAHCRSVGRPVIIATNMLESMITHPVPSRAELTDIAHAVATGADYVMLSGETAHGKYPVRAVQVMRDTLEEAEK
jgi:pyruvate kinase